MLFGIKKDKFREEGREVDMSDCYKDLEWRLVV